jgi:hypothetical protein
MRTVTLTATLLASSVTSFIHAAPQSGNLVQQLQATYVPNVLDASGIKVAQAGSILVVQLDTIQANPRGKLTQAFANSFVDGQIQAPAGLRSRIPFGGGPRPSMGTARALAIGEKVYLLKTEVKDNNVVFVVQSCGTCNPKAVDPAHQPYRAEVDFRFIKGALAATDFKSVQGVIEQVFKFPDAEANTDTGAAAGGAPAAPAAPAAPGRATRQAQPQAEPPAPPQPEAPQKFADIPPPPAPPAPVATKKIALGQTTDEVKATFGEPEQIVELGTKVIYKYKDLKVTFLKGKVTDVE